MLAWLGCFFTHLSYSLRTARLDSSFFIAILGTRGTCRVVGPPYLSRPEHDGAGFEESTLSRARHTCADWSRRFQIGSHAARAIAPSCVKA
jgi:hypothetical protein